MRTTWDRTISGIRYRKRASWECSLSPLDRLALIIVDIRVLRLRLRPYVPIRDKASQISTDRMLVASKERTEQQPGEKKLPTWLNAIPDSRNGTRKSLQQAHFEVNTHNTRSLGGSCAPVNPSEEKSVACLSCRLDKLNIRRDDATRGRNSLLFGSIA